MSGSGEESEKCGMFERIDVRLFCARQVYDVAVIQLRQHSSLRRTHIRRPSSVIVLEQAHGAQPCRDG